MKAFRMTLSMIALAVSAAVSGAELCPGWDWKAYTGKNYLAVVSKTGWLHIYFDEKGNETVLPAGIALFSGSESGGSQYQPEKIKDISGTEEDNAGSKVFKIKGEFLSGATFSEKITCSPDSIAVEFKVRPIPGTHEFYIMPLDCYKGGDRVWNCIMKDSSLSAMQKGAKEPLDLKKAVKEGEGRAVEIKMDQPQISQLVIGECYGRKVTIDVTGDSKTHFYYDKGGDASNVRLELFAGENKDASVGNSAVFSFRYKFESLDGQKEKAEKTRALIKNWKPAGK